MGHLGADHYQIPNSCGKLLLWVIDNDKPKHTPITINHPMWWISSHQYRLAVVKYIAIPHDTTCFPCAFMTTNQNNSSVLIIQLISLGRSKLATNGKNVHHQSPPSRIEFQHGSIRLFHRPCASQGGRQVDEAANPGGREVAVGNFLSGYPSGRRF